MKNKYLLFILIILNSLICKSTFADQFNFQTSDIKVINDGNLIIAGEGTATSQDDNYEIQAKKFEYSKNLKLLIAYDGTLFVKTDNIIIKFGEIKLDKEKNTFTAKENIKIRDIKNEVLIETDEISYNEKLKLLSSKTKSSLRDKSQNILTTEKFDYNLKDKILKIQKANLKDSDDNNFKIDLAYINTISNKLFGKDISLDLNNKSFNQNNEPRLKGNSLMINDDITEITKGVFTTCKRRKDKCPPWQLQAEKIQHDKNEKIINYKNAWLKLYDMPVVYFPKFFHPDPTVNRKSGFLIPTLKNSPNSDSFLSLPYFKVISLNKDITFTPRFYAEDKILIQSEYRQANKDSDHITDFSILKEKNKSSKNHFFYNYRTNLDYLDFENSTLKFKIEKTSNDTYLKANKIVSPIVKNNEVLENSLILNFDKTDMTVDAEFIVYENLSKEKTDRYEYILPKIDITKEMDNKTNLDGEFLLQSSGLIKNYDTNINEKININDFIFNSNSKITSLGILNDYNLIIKNVNSDTDNSSSFKENENYYLSGLYQFNSSLPLIKESVNYQKILKPKISLKISPNHTKNMDSDNNRLDVNNLFSLNRIAASDTLEGGISLAYGNDFSILNKQNTKEIFSLKLANNLRLSDNDNLQTQNQIGQKTSNFFSELMYSPNDFIIANYKNSLKNNLTDISYENLNLEFSINNFVTTFDYLNENDTKDKNSYLKSTARYKMNDTNSILFSTRRNKKTDLTEYYNLIYQYKNDCLAASIEYNKDYYNDDDIKPEESIYFKLTIIPIGETNSPNLIKK
tara:strand:+ start:3874 stop:6267 length:2394 start_codon:yes stop_codon:yes gene_type:complete